MTIPPALAAELALLTRTLDVPGTDIADTLARLVVDVETAVDSFLGLSIVISLSGPPVTLTAFDDNSRPREIKTSLLIPLSSTAGNASLPTSVALVLFAGTPGAFTDLAADLSWITGRPLTAFLVDEHRDLPEHLPGPTSLSTMWTVDQALGVLIGRGSTFECAERELRERAARTGTGLQEAAALVLADLHPQDPEPHVS